jgi:hypothetical protein
MPAIARTHEGAILAPNLSARKYLITGHHRDPPSLKNLKGRPSVSVQTNRLEWQSSRKILAAARFASASLDDSDDPTTTCSGYTPSL